MMTRNKVLSTQPNNEHSLQLTRQLKAPIDKVFAAWTNPKLLANWFGPEEFTVTHMELELKKGGKYLIEIKAPDGNTIKHFGEYIEIQKPIFLAFTWELDNQQCSGSADLCVQTLVSLNLTESGSGTKLQLTHEKLPTIESMEGHHFGWDSSLNSLEKILLTI